MVGQTRVFDRWALVLQVAYVWPFLSAPASPVLAGGFFDGPAATPDDPMFFSVYSILKEQKGNLNLQKLSEGGFTTAGPHYHANNGGDPINNAPLFYSRVADAAEEQLGIIAHITWHPDVINDTTGDVRPDSMDAISEAEIRAHVRQVMDFTLNDAQANAITHKWYTLPEELRPWETGEMRYLNIVADEVKNYDPQNRPVSMYNPNHRTSSQLDLVIGEGLDETLMGVYVTAIPFATRGARVALGADRILASAENTSTTPIMGMQLSTDFDSTELSGLQAALGGVSQAEAITHIIRHDTYQGLMRGIQGVHIWSGCDCRSGLTTYSEQLDGYISVATDMNLDLGLAGVFLQGEWRSDLTATVLSGPTSISYTGGPADYTVDTTTVADIAYGGDRYLFLANSSDSELTIQVDGLPLGISQGQITDLFSNAPELSVVNQTGALLLGMEPLEVIALKISDEPTLAGDYNGDGAVGLADYVVWRDNLGGASLPFNETVSLGVVDSQDYSAWRENFGAAGLNQSLTSAVQVPSPSSAGICLILMVFARLVRDGTRLKLSRIVVVLKHLSPNASH